MLILDKSRWKYDAYGRLTCPAKLCRDGVMQYSRGWILTPTHEIIRIIPLLVGAVVTLGHPVVNPDTQSYKDYAVGSLVNPKSVIDEDDVTWIEGDLVLFDAKAIAAVESGQSSAISLGWDVDSIEEHEPRKHLTVDGEEIEYRLTFDGKVVNHVALVEAGRAGKDARVLDNDSDNYPGNDLDNPMTQEKDPKKNAAVADESEAKDMNHEEEKKPTDMDPMKDMYEKMDGFYGKMDGMYSQFDGMYQKMDGMYKQMSDMMTKMSDMGKKPMDEAPKDSAPAADPKITELIAKLEALETKVQDAGVKKINDGIGNLFNGEPKTDFFTKMEDAWRA